MKEQLMATMNEQLLATLETSKNYTLAVAGAMPSQSYDFRPVPDVWNFGELLHHVAYGIEWWEDNYVKGVQTAWAPPALNGGRKEVTAYLERAYASLEKTVSNTELNETSLKGFHATLDHITHHRGQAVTYLRCKGIAAPEYTY